MRQLSSGFGRAERCKALFWGEREPARARCGLLRIPLASPLSTSENERTTSLEVCAGGVGSPLMIGAAEADATKAARRTDLMNMLRGRRR